MINDNAVDLLEPDVLEANNKQVEQTPYPPNQRYVYFAKDKNTGLIKIGTSSSIPERLKALEGKYKTTMLFLGRVDGHFEVERALHQRFWSYHHSSEWFHPGAELLEFIERETIKELPAEYTPPKRVSKRFFLTVANEPAVVELLKRLGLEGKPIQLVTISLNYQDES